MSQRILRQRSGGELRVAVLLAEVVGDLERLKRVDRRLRGPIPDHRVGALHDVVLAEVQQQLAEDVGTL